MRRTFLVLPGRLLIFVYSRPRPFSGFSYWGDVNRLQRIGLQLTYRRASRWPITLLTFGNLEHFDNPQILGITDCCKLPCLLDATHRTGEMHLVEFRRIVNSKQRLEIRPRHVDKISNAKTFYIWLFGFWLPLRLERASDQTDLPLCMLWVDT